MEKLNVHFIHLSIVILSDSTTLIINYKLLVFLLYVYFVYVYFMSFYEMTKMWMILRQLCLLNVIK